MLVMSDSGIGADYDPLLTADMKTEQVDLTIKDGNRSREIPIRVYLPADKTASPVVLFSHGLGGNREGSAFLGKHWAKRGYLAVFLQHPGSDDSVWKDLPVAQRLEALKKAAGLKDFMLRVQDVPVVLDQLEIWNKDTAHALAQYHSATHFLVPQGTTVPPTFCNFSQYHSATHFLQFLACLTDGGSVNLLGH